MSNIDNNDDVFADDDDDNNSSDSAAQKKESSFAKYGGLNAAGVEIPGYLQEALEKYISQYGGIDRNKKIPFSAILIAEISNLFHQIYRPDNDSTAVAAIWQVLDEATDGALTVRYDKLQIEEKVQMYDYLSALVNRIYVEIEEWVERDGYEETARLARMCLVYFDILSYHHKWYLQEYYSFCQLNETEPNPAVVEGVGFDSSHPWLTNNAILYRVRNAEEDDLKTGMNEFFGELVRGIAQYMKASVTGYDIRNVEKE